MPSDGADVIRQHYCTEAKKHGASPRSTMEDRIIRDRETQLVTEFLGLVGRQNSSARLKVLDLGCGNGYNLSILTKTYPEMSYWGIDLSKEMLDIAKARNLPRCRLSEGDARSLPFDADTFDVVYTVRCLINILDCQEQVSAAREVARVLKEDGYCLMIECFSDGLANCNKAREECELEGISEAYHNKYLDKATLFPAVNNVMKVVRFEDLNWVRNKEILTENFLSSHYFVTRVLFPFIAGGKWKRNTEFAKFLSFLPPMGNYSPIQAYVLKKSSGGDPFDS